MKKSNFSLERFLSREPKSSALIALATVVCMFFLYTFRTSEPADIRQDAIAAQQLYQSNRIAQQPIILTEKPCKARQTIIILQERYHFSVN